MKELTQRQFKTILWIIVAIIIFLIGTILFFLIQNNINSATVNILVAPQSSAIMIDGKKYESGIYKMPPGDYTIEVSKENFETKTESFTAVSGEEVSIRIYLEQIEGTGDWYGEHEWDSVVMGDIRADEAWEKMQKFYDENEILKVFPISVEYYTNNYSKYVKYTINSQINEDITDFKILIDDETGGNYDAAVENMKARGYDLNNYEVEYIDKSVEKLEGKAIE